ncbi:DNA methyltransferase [Desulforhabdus sp. TSK]|uniref:DNA methyltransferase n=1 Tax=Desulforhabdus sp. TSK TaxID=2925014 RepID=UPI0034D79ABA
MEQLRLDLHSHEKNREHSGPVTCLGMTFENDEARRAHFTEELRKKLQDPEFRKIEGFPIGSDEDILNLSDPPYYTACPNPWIADFIAEWEAQKREQPEGNQYHREPFAADVSEGKYDPVYRMHPYHTKVPHKAIMRYILHYTQPGDIVFDGFCGTGMTGVAARLCGDRAEVLALGYQVKPDGTILQEELDENGKRVWRPFSKLGARKAILNDLSPAATYISSSYNTPADGESLKSAIYKVIDMVEERWGWLFETTHKNGKKGKINSVIWSDVFVCPECSADIVFWENAVDIENGKVLDEFECSECGANLTKRSIERRWTTSYDPLIGKSVTQAKQVPVRINYVFGGKKYDKKASKDDLELLDNIASYEHNIEHPITEIIDGDKTGEALKIGFTHVHHLYSTRNYIALSEFKNLCKDSRLWIPLTIVAFRITKRYGLTYQSGTWGAGGGPQNGTYYIPSLIKELNILRMLRDAVEKIVFHSGQVRNCITTQSSSKVAIPDNILDYVFIDPPFGSNLNYSELNLVWESWLGAKTNNKEEAIENKSQNKGSVEYRDLMTRCFQEVYRILAPGRWMTIEFSNTKASVWNNIQTSITDAGFVIANVSALDKKKGSFNAQTNPTSVKQDLVISAYKPNGGFEERFQKEAQTEEGVWDFVRTHLKYLPVTKQQGALLQFVPERDPRILFDQMVAYYVRKGYPVPISSQEFQNGLALRFIERDGMFFLPDQVAEYDRKKMTSGELKQMSIFVSDEASAIQWLRQLIKEKPQTFSDINPQFMQQLGGWSKNEAQLDLRELLNQNFLCYDGKGPVPEQIHAYLSTNWKELRNLPKEDPTLVAKARDRWYVPDPNKAGDLEKLREKALLKEFEEYKEVKKKLKVFRLEAVRAGFKKAWQERDYAVIVAVADKIPNNVLEEDPKLLMWYDQAATRMGGDNS